MYKGALCFVLEMCVGQSSDGPTNCRSALSLASHLEKLSSLLVSSSMLMSTAETLLVNCCGTTGADKGAQLSAITQSANHLDPKLRPGHVGDHRAF